MNIKNRIDNRPKVEQTGARKFVSYLHYVIQLFVYILIHPQLKNIGICAR